MPAFHKCSYKILLFASSFLIGFLFSCSDNSKSEIAAFKALDESLSRTNQRLAKSNEMIYASLEDKLRDPAVSAKAEIWNPKALRIQKLSRDITNHIHNLKNKADKEILTADEINDLYERLKKYKSGVVNIDLKIKNAFDTTLIFATRELDLASNNKINFANALFGQLPKEGILAMLSKFQSNIIDAENRLILFCHDHCIVDAITHDWFWPIVGQSNTYVRGGEKIEITAGVGSFSSRFQPEIIINNHLIPLNGTGIAITKFPASKKPGKHFVPVEIIYTDQDGKKQTIAKTVEYTVTKE